LDKLLNNPEELKELRDHGFDYVKENHEIRIVAAQIIKTLINVI